MSWLLLALAIALEVAGTTSMKLSQGFTKTAPSIAMGLFYAASFSLMALVLRTIEVSVAYAVWSGLGTALIAVIGVVVFGESVSPLKVISLVLIIAGVIGLNLSGGAH